MGIAKKKNMISTHWFTKFKQIWSRASDTANSARNSAY